MLSTLGFVFLLIGVVLVICGYTIAPQALRPGFGCLIVALILIVLAYLLPAVTTHDDYDTAQQPHPVATHLQ